MKSTVVLLLIALLLLVGGVIARAQQVGSAGSEPEIPPIELVPNPGTTATSTTKEIRTDASTTQRRADRGMGVRTQNAPAAREAPTVDDDHGDVAADDDEPDPADESSPDG